jgi:hypothetical protein
MKQLLLGVMLLSLFLVMGCGGSTQLSVKMALASTSPSINPEKEVKKENRTEEICTWYLFSIPLGEKSSPVKAFNKLNTNAAYVTDMALYPSGWSFYPIGEGYLVAKSCWNADGTAAIYTGAN